MFNPREPAISAAILLNAYNPRQIAPDLPGLVPTARGVFTEGGGSAGDVTARRVGKAWLVVQGGPPALRKRLLEQLRARAPLGPTGAE